MFIQGPEVIEQSGDAKDWRNLVGTGPLMQTDVVEGSSYTWDTKNPNYWGYDEKYPENRLPYVDELRFLLMPEVATRLAALRTGKIDFIGEQGGGFYKICRPGREPPADQPRTRNPPVVTTSG